MRGPACLTASIAALAARVRGEDPERGDLEKLRELPPAIEECLDDAGLMRS